MVIKKIAVIGAGMMGSSLAQVFASCPGLSVALTDSNPDVNWAAPIEKNLDLMIKHGAAGESIKKEVLSRIRFNVCLKTVTSDADFIIECVPEIMDVKQKLFAEVENYCRSDSILATNTSVMSVSEIASGCVKQDRIVGVHFWNPGHLIPLVEVVKAEHTSDETIKVAMKLMEDCGKKPILCKKDVPGFVANRLQHALWREAFFMVQEGIADPATVDDACKYGPGLRWPVLGPMENSDMVGIGLSYNIHSYILKFLADNHEPSPLLLEMLDRGDMGFTSGKGWQEWTQEAADASKNNLQEYLIRRLK